jgi:putative ABC transport system permease protein
VAVSLLLAFGQGLHQNLAKAQAGLGDAICIAWPSRTSVPFEGLGRGRRIRLGDEDMKLLAARADLLDAISGEYMRTLKLTYAEKTVPTDVSGIVPVYGTMRNVIPKAGGRWINDLDELHQRRSIFLGDKLATTVFGAADPVGKVVQLQGSPFTVVGVMIEKKQDSSYSGRDQDKAWIAASTFRALTGDDYIDNFIFRARDVTKTEAAKTQVLEVVAGKHRFDPKDKEAIGIWDTTEGTKFLDAFMLGFQSFLGIVGSLTLVVGGIGVSNIMNVVVEERTREIGIKMALGARSRWILAQFILETLLLTAVGGAIGLALSWGICAIFPSFGLADYVGTPEISPFVAGITAALLGVIGLFAGWFPARDAAALDPVIAMKL